VHLRATAAQGSEEFGVSTMKSCRAVSDDCVHHFRESSRQRLCGWTFLRGRTRIQRCGALPSSQGARDRLQSRAAEVTVPGRPSLGRARRSCTTTASSTPSGSHPRRAAQPAPVEHAARAADATFEYVEILLNRQRRDRASALGMLAPPPYDTMNRAIHLAWDSGVPTPQDAGHINPPTAVQVGDDLYQLEGKATDGRSYALAIAA
jgi:hypothetical protein